MRTRIFFVLFFLIPLFSQAQTPQLRFGEPGPRVLQDSIRIGDTFQVRYWIVNIDPDPWDSIHAQITTFCRTEKSTDSAASLSTHDLFLVPGDSEEITASFVANENLFTKGEASIVVVWPTGGGTENAIPKKAVEKKVFTQYNLNVRLVGVLPGGASIYPNPMHRTLTFETKSGKVIKELVIKDIRGRTCPPPVLQNRQADLSYLDNGVYILHVRFQDNSVSTFRIIKQ